MRVARRLLRDNRFFVRRYFEHLYSSEDPYGIIDDAEEQEKRSRTLAAVADKRFENALEIGCGEGILGAQLAGQVDTLLMVDLSERALERATERAREYPHVRLQRLDILADPLPDDHDLVVCSETLVYIPVGDLELVKDKILAAIRPAGMLLLVHSRSIHDDDSGLEYKDIGAKTVHELFIADPTTVVEHDELHEMYRITLLKRV